MIGYIASSLIVKYQYKYMYMFNGVRVENASDYLTSSSAKASSAYINANYEVISDYDRFDDRVGLYIISTFIMSSTVCNDLIIAHKHVIICINYNSIYIFHSFGYQAYHKTAPQYLCDLIMLYSNARNLRSDNMLLIAPCHPRAKLKS